MKILDQGYGVKIRFCSTFLSYIASSVEILYPTAKNPAWGQEREEDVFQQELIECLGQDYCWKEG